MKKGVSIVIATLALLAFWELASLALDKAFLPGPLTSLRPRQSAKDRAHHAHHFLSDLRGRL